MKSIICKILGHKWFIESCSFNKLGDGEYVFYTGKCLRCGIMAEAQMPFFQESGDVSYAEKLSKT